jgi:membrane-associated phospholipid phosphatase
MKRHLAILALGAMSWWGAFRLRGTWIQPHCSRAADACLPAHVPALDRWAIGWNDPRADWLSFFTQDFSGVLALLVPAAWVAYRRLPWASYLEDFLFLLEATVWNGATKELVNAITQRPRPFVYANPAAEGLDLAHYTSFYSGHTSFSALASLSLYLALRRRLAPPSALRAAAVIGGLLVATTALTRILAGRHFLTDTIGGAVFGAAIAWVVTYRPERRPA